MATKEFHYGGQAVVEGVMMRGQKNTVTAVRRNNGELAIDDQPLPALYTSRARKTPLIRGIIVLIEALALGIKILLHSANVVLEEEGEKISEGWVWIMLTFSMAISVGLFFIAPLFLTRLLDPFIQSSILFHLIEGLIRLVLFLIFLRLIALEPEIRRTFAYHGAEHKTVNAFEAGIPLEVDAIKRYGTTNIRCGTSFMFTVLIIAILVFALIGRPDSLWLLVLSRVFLIPVIAALGYEVTHFAGRHTKNHLVRAILYPGLLLQRLTTREPDDSQLEVALAALKRVIEIEQPEERAQAASG